MAVAALRGLRSVETGCSGSRGNSLWAIAATAREAQFWMWASATF